MVQRSKTQKECLNDVYNGNDINAPKHMIIEEQTNYNSSSVLKQRPQLIVDDVASVENVGPSKRISNA